MAPGRGTQPPANLAGIVTLDCPNAAAVIVGEEERNCGCLTVGVCQGESRLQWQQIPIRLRVHCFDGC